MLIDPQSEKFNQFFAAEAESMFVEQPSWQDLIAGSFQRSRVVLGVEESKNTGGRGMPLYKRKPCNNYSDVR